MLHGQDLLGDGVNVAARLQTAAEPGGICISGSVHDQISNKLSLSFQSLGEMNFKNIQTPVRTFSITHAQGHGDLPSPKPRGGGRPPAKWIAAGLLLLAILAGGSFWAYTARERSKAEQARVSATAAQPEVTRPEAPPPSQPEVKAAPAPPPVSQPKLKPAQAPPASKPETKPETKIAQAPLRPNPPANSQGGAGAAVATSAMSSGGFDGDYSGPICYSEFRKMAQRCYQAKGTISGSKISGQWTMGPEKKISVLLTGDVAKSGDVKIEIVQRDANLPHPAKANLTGAVRGGLINASGSFLNGRAATLDWHKNSAAPH